MSLKRSRAAWPVVQPFVRAILEHMASVTVAAHREQNRGWEDLWKSISERGFDMINGRQIDYGNYEYATLLHAFCLLDQGVQGGIS